MEEQLKEKLTKTATTRKTAAIAEVLRQTTVEFFNSSNVTMMKSSRRIVNIKATSDDDENDEAVSEADLNEGTWTRRDKRTVPMRWRSNRRCSRGDVSNLWGYVIHGIYAPAITGKASWPLSTVSYITALYVENSM